MTKKFICRLSVPISKTTRVGTLPMQKKSRITWCQIIENISAVSVINYTVEAINKKQCVRAQLGSFEEDETI
jgi:hypothetical protein